MAALTTGRLAPDFTLPTLEGRKVSLTEALAKGPVVLAFFKTTCPVCQYAFPFLERLYQRNPSDNVTYLGVSQDKAGDTRDFLRACGVTFPVVLDDPANYAVSNAYGLTNVPTVFYIAPGGEIEVSSVGWSKSDMETINRKLAEYRQQSPAVLWQKGEDVHDYKAG